MRTKANLRACQDFSSPDFHAENGLRMGPDLLQKFDVDDRRQGPEAVEAAAAAVVPHVIWKVGSIRQCNDFENI